MVRLILVFGCSTARILSNMCLLSLGTRSFAMGTRRLAFRFLVERGG
jgi:hypothetical protein